MYKSIIPIFSLQRIDVEFLDRFIIDFYRDLYKKFLEEKKYIDNDNLIEFKYEDFVKDPLTILRGVYDKFGFGWFEEAKPNFERYIEKHKNYKAHQYTIDEELREKIGKEWGFAFKEFDYEI